MRKGLLVLLCLVTLALVSACDMTEIDVTNNTKNIQTICIDNVTYVKFKELRYGYMSVKLDTNSKIILCGEAN